MQTAKKLDTAKNETAVPTTTMNVVKNETVKNVLQEKQILTFEKLMELAELKAKKVSEWKSLNEHCKELENLQFEVGAKNKDEAKAPLFKLYDSKGFAWATSNTNFIDKVRAVMVEAIKVKLIEKQTEIENIAA